MPGQPPDKSPAQQLTTPVQYMKGVGPQRAELLEKLDLHIARDVLYFFPRDYQDMSVLTEIDDLVEGQAASICGEVVEVEQKISPGKTILGVLIKQGGNFLRMTWFNMPYLRRRFTTGKRVLASGTPKLRGLRWEMMHPTIEFLLEGEEPPAGRILPIYPLTEGISQSAMRRIVWSAVEQYTEFIEEVFPDEFLDEHRLWPIKAALPQMHQPASRESLASARSRFVYQELLVLQIGLAMRRNKLVETRRAPMLPTSAKIEARIRRLFPFEWTEDQRKASDEIALDMARDVPMNRLLQGDVGSGKTVVAVHAMLIAAANHHQSVLMAPTEVLAQQHARSLDQYLAHARVRVGLITGSLPSSVRQHRAQAIAAGEIDLIIGTQALIQSELEFNKLGLVIIDEQHKFGVHQRATLRRAGLDPHYLIMTATPIPRTVTMTLFGDLDISTIKHAPPGRRPVRTYLGAIDQRTKWWEFVRKKLDEGRQAYVITPMIEETERALAGVVQVHERLVREELRGYRIGIVHGRMSPQEKELAMRDFRTGATQVLVSTSVVEVGVDVPNATVMTIEDGQVFGLSQLHQLRGRVSRGTHPGYLCVFAEPTSEESEKRLEAFAKTSDGFELAEIDFELRGPGDLFGSRQHGLPPLRIANLIRDAEVVGQARTDAQSLLLHDPQLSAPDFGKLKKMVLVRYGKVLELADVG
jgi:ATP-dependent DNA helicase RecG